MPDFKSRRPPHVAIKADAFNSGNALSFRNQPSFASLLNAIRGEEPLTFILGAGISVDSGFPTWDGLIRRLAGHISHAETRRLAEQDVDGPMRHAESIFRMISADNPDTDADTLRSALYADMPRTEPGAIARIIAELWAKRDPKITLITTNFDDVIEEALERHLERDLRDVSYSLYAEAPADHLVPEHERDYGGIGMWRRRLASEPSEPSVMHLHGMTRRQKSPLRPVILSESHFLWHGSAVRDVVREQLESSIVVFIGVSLNDPNLVGPLWDVSRRYTDTPRSHDCYVLHVPGSVAGADSIESARAYVLRKYEYMEEALGVTPVFFKSYSQLFQCFIEANLALDNDDYFETAEERTGYGARFDRRLLAAWNNVGAKKAIFDEVSLEKRQAVSDDLASVLDPDEQLGAMLSRPDPKSVRRLRRLKRDFEDYDYDDEPERFGIFVWLRSLPAVDGHEAAPYALNLAASSTYVHRDAWSFNRAVAIEPDSEFPVARAVYSGLLTRANLPPTGRFTVWRGTWALPLRLANRRLNDASDVVTIGAIALNTTHYVIPDDSHRGHVSVLAALFEDQSATEEVRRTLEKSVAALVGRFNDRDDALT